MEQAHVVQAQPNLDSHAAQRTVLVFAAGALLSLISLLIGFGLGYALVRDGLPVAVIAPADGAAIAAITPPAPQPTVLPDVAVADTLAGARDFARLGHADAPVKIVVFADPQCPFCRQSAHEGEKQLVAEFVDKGQASLTYRHMAFLGPDSTRIATAMECAGGQGKFWPFHQVAFASQLPENSGLVTDSVLAKWASEAGLDGDVFKRCLADGKATQAVADDVAAARRLGVTGTPTIFVNGRRLVGALPYNALKAAVEGALAEAKR